MAVVKYVANRLTSVDRFNGDVRRDLRSSFTTEMDSGGQFCGGEGGTFRDATL